MTSNILALFDDLDLDCDLPQLDSYHHYGCTLVLNEELLFDMLEPEQQAALILVTRGYTEARRELVHTHFSELVGEDFAEEAINAVHYIEREVEELLCGAGFARECGYSTAAGFDLYEDERSGEESTAPVYDPCQNEQDYDEDYSWTDESLHKEVVAARLVQGYDY